MISGAIVPIANDGCGNQIMLSFHQNPPTVELCIHDDGMRIIHVADSFSQFIDSLCVDPDMI